MSSLFKGIPQCQQGGSDWPLPFWPMRSRLLHAWPALHTRVSAVVHAFASGSLKDCTGLLSIRCVSTWAIFGRDNSLGCAAYVGNTLIFLLSPSTVRQPPTPWLCWTNRKMSFPFKPSTSKSGRLTRQANVTSGGSHSHDTPSKSDSFLQSLNPRSTLLLHAELPKPMSRLPEIRLDDRSSGSGGKVQVGQVKPQKSCESYDSAASGMSWSSSQSTVAVGAGYCNSTSVSGNPSFASYEEDDEPMQSRSQQSIVRIPSTPGALHRAQYSPRCDSTQHGMGQPFKRDFSFEEVRVTSGQPHEQTRENRDSEERNEVVESPSEKAADFFDSVFDEQEKEVRTINFSRLIFTAPYPLLNFHSRFNFICWKWPRGKGTFLNATFGLYQSSKSYH